MFPFKGKNPGKNTGAMAPGPMAALALGRDAKIAMTGSENTLKASHEIFSWESKVPPPKLPPPRNSRPYDQGL